MHYLIRVSIDALMLYAGLWAAGAFTAGLLFPFLSGFNLVRRHLW